VKGNWLKIKINSLAMLKANCGTKKRRDFVANALDRRCQLPVSSGNSGNWLLKWRFFVNQFVCNPTTYSKSEEPKVGVLAGVARNRRIGHCYQKFCD